MHVPAPQGGTPLEHASPWANCEVVKLLAARVKEQHILDRALYATGMASDDNSAAKVAQILLEAGADPNSRHPFTALHRAAMQGCFAELCRVLLEAGADPNAVGPRGSRPLHLAKGTEVRRVLLGHGADPDARDDAGRRPFER